MRNRSISGKARIDDMDIAWTLRSELRWTPEHGYQGLTFSARIAGETWRELILELPYPGEKPTGYVSVLERPDVSPAQVEEGIRMAIEAGWKPLSRGRAFHFQIPDEDAADAGC